MQKKEKIALIFFVLFILLMLCILGGYFYFSQKYPLKYQKEIQKYADAYDLDPYFVASIINVESGYRKSSVSKKGAMGLMQIMPETGKWIAKHLKEDNFDSQQLLQMETNLRYGCWYLQYLMKRFDGDIRLVAAAYNAGPNKVSQWLKEGTIKQKKKELSGIPYPETEEYVKKVERAYEIYKTFYQFS